MRKRRGRACDVTERMDPRHIGRLHRAQVNVVHVANDNERVYSGDINGTVACTLTRTFRAIALWAAHIDSILSIEEWNRRIITYVQARAPSCINGSNILLRHGRDNKLHIWDAIDTTPAVTDTATASSSNHRPTRLYSLDVNALNFCRFSLLPLVGPHRPGYEALLAVPNLVESEFVSDDGALTGSGFR